MPELTPERVPGVWTIDPPANGSTPEPTASGAWTIDPETTYADKYQRAAAADRQRFLDYNRNQPWYRPNIPLPGESYADLVAQGRTFGFSDELMAGLEAPVQAIRRGVSIPEGYRYAKSAQDIALDRAREKPAAELAEIGGGLLSGLGVLNYGPKTMARVPLTLNLIGRPAAIGAVSGAGYAPDLASVPEDAAGRAFVMGTLFGLPFAHGAAAYNMAAPIFRAARTAVRRFIP